MNIKPMVYYYFLGLNIIFRAVIHLGVAKPEIVDGIKIIKKVVLVYKK